MMGAQQSQSPLFSYSVNLDKRVRADHPLRKVATVLDLSWVRQEVAHCYGRNGNVSVDPVVLVKMMLLLFLDNIPSERELMGIIRERLDYLWFLGYGLDEEVPDHSVLSKARARWGGELFEQIFSRVVLQCVQAGLVGNERLHLDSSLVKASASKDSIIESSPELVQALRAAYQEQELKLEEMNPKAVNATRVSTTDPHATLARGGNQQSCLGYKNHRAVDDAYGVITAVQTTTGQAGDAKQATALIAEHQRHTGSNPQIVVGDQHYGTAENYRCFQQQGITTHLKQTRHTMEARGFFGPEQFSYEDQGDRYRCPAGNYLYYHNHLKHDQLVEYRIETSALCQRCALRAQCTTSRFGRTVTRPVFAELVFAGRAQAESPSAWESYRRRKYRIEGSFADAANNHGLKRARWRGLLRQRIQDWLIATVQNLRILIKYGRNFGSQCQSAAEVCFWAARNVYQTFIACVFSSPTPETHYSPTVPFLTQTCPASSRVVLSSAATHLGNTP